MTGAAIPSSLRRMPALKSRLAREYETIRKMVKIYCHDHHSGTANCPCAECRAFLYYAGQRLERCPYGQGKPTCARCPIHCYKRRQRQQAREIMRYAGPRMLLRHPWATLRHSLDKLRRVEHPMELRRRARESRPDH
jgi:hypothetical protein